MISSPCPLQISTIIESSSSLAAAQLSITPVIKEIDAFTESAKKALADNTPPSVCFKGTAEELQNYLKGKKNKKKKGKNKKPSSSSSASSSVAAVNPNKDDYSSSSMTGDDNADEMDCELEAYLAYLLHKEAFANFRLCTNELKEK